VTATKVPGFIVIGAPKAGTTSLFNYLCQHPQVFRPPLKEPRFFAIEGHVPSHRERVHWLVDTWEGYVDHFSGARPDQLGGDASGAYLYSTGVIERIRQRAPEVPLVAILRHPVEATWSHYLMARGYGKAQGSFEEEIDREPLEPVATQWAWELTMLVRARLYHAHLTRWLDAFPRDQLLVHLYEDLREDPAAVVRRTFSHLGLDPDVPLDVSERSNVGTDPRSLRLHAFEHRPGRVARHLKLALRRVPGRRTVQSVVLRWNERPVPPVPSASRQRLLDVFRSDTDALEELLGRDLSAWRR
jgi:hypothetical protein